MAAPFFMPKVAKAEEVIRHFDVTADIHEDGTVDILEKITVRAEGNQIIHGIYRDIPTEFKDTKGKIFQMPFTLKGIWVDDQKKPYHMKRQVNGQRIYIGDKKKNVPIGEHIYTLRYQVARVIGFFPEGDEFYWNVTGNGWDFPIEKASITVNFPDGAQILRTTGYTGIQGSRLNDYKGIAYGQHFSAETTTRLNPREGFTIAASVPVGTIQKETTFQQMKYFFQENSMWLIWMSFAFVVIAYLLQAWVYHGRDLKGVIVPRFDAPDVEPDLLRYIYRQAYDAKTFTALIVNAASHHKIKIKEEDNATLFILTDKARVDDGRVTYMDILRAAFLGMGSIVIPKHSFLGSKINLDVGQALWAAKISHQKNIEEDSQRYIDKNTKYIVYGFFIAILGTLWAAFIALNDEQQGRLMLGSAVFYGIVLMLFSKIMPKYTQYGQDIFDHAEGLKMYMKTAEQERMNVLYPKEITPEKFEKLLPYAIALDVEQEWCNYIDALVKAGSISPESNWDGDTMSDYHTYRTFSHGLDSLTSVISSAMTPPASSSGFGGGSGGGSSGGGGGGGGGGGW